LLKKTNARVKNLRHGFLVERVKKKLKCDVYRSLPLILSWTGVEFPQTYAFAKKRLNYAISYDFEIFKGKSRNLELLSFQKMCGL